MKSESLKFRFDYGHPAMWTYVKFMVIYYSYAIVNYRKGNGHSGGIF